MTLLFILAYIVMSYLTMVLYYKVLQAHKREHTIGFSMPPMEVIGIFWFIALLIIGLVCLAGVAKKTATSFSVSISKEDKE